MSIEQQRADVISQIKDAQQRQKDLTEKLIELAPFKKGDKVIAHSRHNKVICFIKKSVSINLQL